MSSSSQALVTMNSDIVEGEPSTPRSARNVQEAIVEVNLSSPIQVGVGSFQPTPNGTKYWVPEANNKPVEGTTFDTLELALKAYKAYARQAGFEVRKGGSWKTTTNNPNPNIRYFHCVRQGFKPAPKPIDAKNDKRPIDSALGVTKVYKFLKKHNHSLVNQDDIKYLRTSRRLTYSKQMLLNQLSNINIGPVRSWKVMKEVYGGFEKIGATEVDCKNYKLGLNNFIGERDAQMVVDKLLSRQEFFNDFSVEYKLTKPDKQLVGLFWADEEAKRNYEAFGDVVSFDATFRSNRYIMVLVPFIGIDNHNKCVIFAVALLSTESAKRYRRVLKRFKKVFVKVPKVVIIDQDPAMKIAIEEILSDTRHRLCMWHIMQKLSSKVGPSLSSNDDFKRRLCGIIWTDKIDAAVFEKQWNSIMDEIYSSLMTCYSVSINTDDTCSVHVIRDTEADYKINGVSVEVKYEVKYVPADCTVNCSCLKYECFGLLGRHIFYVLRMSKVYNFPKKYLQRRWSKHALPSKNLANSVDVANSSNQLVGVDGVIRGIFGHVEEAVSRLVNDIQKITIYNDDLAALLEKIKFDVPDLPEMNKDEVYAAALGVTEPTEVIIQPPSVARNKGERSSKRLQSRAEIAMIQANKTPRFCRTCKTYGFP